MYSKPRAEVEAAVIAFHNPTPSVIPKSVSKPTVSTAVAAPVIAKSAAPVSAPEMIKVAAPVSTPIAQPVKPIVAPAQKKTIEMHKPFAVSLANLKPKGTVQNSTAKKIDPKVPTKENVNSLKNALASILEKNGANVSVKDESAKQPEVLSRPTKPAANVTEKSPSSVKEVPEDVLNDVLKVDMN